MRSVTSHNSPIIIILQLALMMSLATALPMPMFANFANDKSDLIMVDRPRKIGSLQGSSANKDLLEDVPSGEALDLFYRYGFYSLSVRVVPRDDPGSWLIREPTATIFQPQSFRTRMIPGENMFDSHFQMFFCDDISELQEAYFRDFSVEGIEKPFKLYTGSWHTSTKSKYFGLSKDMFDGSSKFVLVKLAKKRATIVVEDKPQLKPDAQNSINQIQIGNSDSILKFTRSYGSHYIRDVAIGDIIYQVFALDDSQYKRAKNARFTNALSFYNDYLAPWHVRETGKVLLASGDKSAFRWIDQNLRRQEQFDSYPNIFKILELSSQDEMTLEDLTKDTSAVIGLHLSSLRSWVPDINVREYYDEIVDTNAALWAANI